MSLQVPAGGGKKSKHTRSVTNFCKEANIAESDQLDLAEFIVAARYLGTDANDDQLMNVFLEMEDSDANAKDPKQLIKELMQKVADDYGLDSDADAKQNDAADGDGDGDDGDREIMAANPLDVFAEDAIWQEDQIDSFLNQNQQDQNLKIARNLLATTALTRHEIAEITGVEADLLMDYESDYSSDEEESGDEEENDDEEEDNDAQEKEETKEKEKAKEEKKEEVSEGVTIRASDFSKSVMLTKEDLGTLKELLDGGKEEVSGKSEEALKLLKKLNNAININPKGHNKRTKTLARLKVDKVDASSPTNSKSKQKQPTEVKLPAKYRVVIHPGALCKDGKELSSAEVCKLPIGTVVTVEEISGRRARVSSPSLGWLSLHASDGRIILERSNVKSVAMDKAIHAERARQTKVLILKSITTLNDATVTRILEKSDWNLRRAIEAFYIAKYKTQEYLTKKEKKKNSKEKENSKQSGNEQAQEKGAAASGGSGKTSPVPVGGAGKKGKTAWWKSWKTFANENQ